MDDDWGTIAYDEERKRWQWWSRYVGEADARANVDHRLHDGELVLLVRMAVPQPPYHQCQPECACFRETVMRYEPDTRIG